MALTLSTLTMTTPTTIRIESMPPCLNPSRLMPCAGFSRVKSIFSALGENSQPPCSDWTATTAAATVSAIGPVTSATVLSPSIATP